MGCRQPLADRVDRFRRRCQPLVAARRIGSRRRRRRPTHRRQSRMLLHGRHSRRCPSLEYIHHGGADTGADGGARAPRRPLPRLPRHHRPRSRRPPPRAAVARAGHLRRARLRRRFPRPPCPRARPRRQRRQRRQCQPPQRRRRPPRRHRARRPVRAWCSSILSTGMSSRVVVSNLDVAGLHSISVSSDGQTAYVARRTESQCPSSQVPSAEIVEVSLHGTGEPRVIARSGQSPYVSPDGKHVAYFVSGCAERGRRAEAHARRP